MQKSVFIIIILLFVVTQVSTAQYSFVNYDYTNGLPLDEVKEIVEDKKGYMWLGGPQGLSRFDGRNFTHYNLASTTHSVAGNIVNDIKVTPGGDVVVVYDDSGISVYNHNTDSFRSKIYEDSDSTDFPKYAIFFVYIENDTSAYLGANREGFYHINLRTFESKKIPIDIIPSDMVPFPGQKGSYLITTGGLHKLDMSDHKVTNYTGKGFSGIYVNGSEVIYNGYGTELYKYDLLNGNLKTYPLAFNGVIRGWTIVDQNLWVGTAEGLEVIDTSSAEVINIMRAGSDVHDLKGNFIYKVYKDNKSRIWVGTDGGLSLYDPSKAYFNRTSFLLNSSSDLSILESGEFISLDFYGNTVKVIDQSEAEIDMQIKDKLRGPLETIKYRDNTLILFFNGIGILDQNKKTVTAFKSPFTKTEQKGLIDLEVIDDKWLGIYRYKNYLISYDPFKDNIDTLFFNTEPRGILKIDDQNIFIYGVDILYKYNLKTGKTVRFDLSDKLLEPLAKDVVKIDKIGAEYLISSRINGISKARFNSDGVELLKHYNSESGLTNNNVVNTYLDEYKNLFVQCRSSIFMLDKRSDRFVSLGGMNELNFQSTYGIKTLDSVVYALGFKSKSIDLRKVDATPQKQNTIIESIVVNNLLQFDSNVEDVELKYNENNINLKFSTIEFSEPSSVRHRYRLDTIGDWTYLDPGSKSIHLSALAVGNYIFQLSTIKRNEQWSSPLKWKFSIEPPFWKRWWFILSLFIGLISIAYVLYKVRMSQITKLNDMNLKLAELESESLRAQMNPHFIFNALNSIKAFIIKSKKEEAADYLTIFSELMRAVLKNSKQKVISLKNEIEALSLYLQIENLRLNQKFEFNIDISDDINPDRIAFPPLIIQPFVENSIWHGFINKEDKGKLDIKIKKKDNTLIIEVIDDGIGRDASKKIEKSRGRERSYGIAITENRLSNITSKAEIQIIDLYHENGQSKGTKVVIEVPFKILDNN